MKKIICFLLALFLLTISICVYCPIGVFAAYPDDYYSLPKPYTDGMSLSSSDAQAAVNSHKDIADSRGILCFQYTPTDTYNWTANTSKQKIHFSDNQLKNLLMSKHALTDAFLEFIYGASNSNAYRGFISSVGLATKTDSDTLLSISDKITGNYNYLNAIDYNEETQTITMSNDNSSVDKLREEIIKQYYSSIGCFYIKSSGKPFNAVNDFKTKYEYDDELNSDLTASNNFDSAISFKQYSDYVLNYFWDDSDFDYLFFDNCGNGASYYPKVLTYSNDGLTKHNPCGVMTSFYGTYSLKDGDSFKSNKFIGNYNGSNIVPLYNKDNIAETNFLASKFDCSGYFTSYTLIYYSKTGKPFTPFKSYSAYYNFINGNQNAYLSSLIYEKGRDLQFSINNMSQNFTEQMDKLIDNINSNKSNMSADELQNAIDKGLEDLNKNTEDIKDNTEEMNNKLDSVLEALNTQNETLLAILGVTKKIADTVDDIDENANFSSLMSLLSTVFLGIQNAILYGQNTMNSDNSTDAQAVMYDEDEIAVYSSGGGTSLDYRGGIFGHFPFSVIYHLYDWLKVLQTEPKCPEFTYNYGFMIGRKDDTECQITFDLSQYESWRDVISSFMKLSFTLAVAVGTYKKFKGGDIS